MQIHKVGYAETEYFSEIIIDYLAKAEKIRPFYKHAFSLSAFKKAIKDVQKQKVDRVLLQTVLQQQYANIEKTAAVIKNIELIKKKKTFVVVTGHQTSLFTGHLYFIYKIISAINLSEILCQRYPDYHFIPMYWMGSEDHDFEEINHIHLYGKTLRWQQDQEGATGRISTQSLQTVLNELKNIIGNSTNGTALYRLLSGVYLEQPTLAKATQHLVNKLFGKYGLLVLDQDSHDLKKAFVSIMEKELLTQASQPLVKITNQQLGEQGYFSQAFARPINLFYLTDTYRQRITFNTETQYYQINQQEIRFSKAEILEELHQYPERFSPNVILRPVYQQAVVPSVAYIGGGGELAYWLQLKEVFNHYQVSYPILGLRNSALWIDKTNVKKMKKTNISLQDLFRNKEKLIIEYVKYKSEHQLNLFSEKERLQCIFDNILKKATNIDNTLQASVIAERRKMEKSFANLETKLLRAEKKNYEIATNQIRTLFDRLFPNDSLQERHDNFIPFYERYGDNFIEQLKQELHPLEKKFTIFVEEE